MIDHCSLVFSSLVYSLIGCFKLLKLLWFSNYLPEVNFTYSLHTVLVSYEKRQNLNSTMQNRGTPLVCSDLFIFREILKTQVASWDQPGTSVCSKTPEHKIWKEEPWHYRGLKHMVVDGVLFLASSTYKYTDTHTHRWITRWVPAAIPTWTSDIAHCLRLQPGISYQGQAWGCHSQREFLHTLGFF